MSLPTRATLDDIEHTCKYLAGKPTGATLKDISSIVGEKLADSRRISALQSWGLIEIQEDGKYKVTELGRLSTKGDEGRNEAMKEVLRRTNAYLAILERAAHRKEDSIIINDVGAHWHNHHKNEASDNDETLKAQAISFFQVAEGAGLGTMIVGRRGQQTRFSFSFDRLKAFVHGTESITQEKSHSDLPNEQDYVSEKERRHEPETTFDTPDSSELSRHSDRGKGIFIAHGKNKKPLEQLKRVLDQFHIPYKVATDEPNLGRPIGAKVREIMNSCNCAILIFTADEEFKNTKGDTIWRPSENVVHELGASAYLYDNRIVIMKEEIVNFPSNFRDLGYIPFETDQLEAKSMDLLKELIGFKIVKFTT